jgi:hypothetical protein
MKMTVMMAILCAGFSVVFRRSAVAVQAAASAEEIEKLRAFLGHWTSNCEMKDTPRNAHIQLYEGREGSTTFWPLSQRMSETW